MNHLSDRGLVCPNVLKSNNGELSVIINGKPSAIIEKLSGKSIIDTNPNICMLIGNLLSEFHNFGSDFKRNIKNSRDISWCVQSYDKLAEVITDDQLKLIEKAINIQKEFLTQNLPMGTIPVSYTHLRAHET